MELACLLLLSFPGKNGVVNDYARNRAGNRLRVLDSLDAKGAIM